MAQQALPPNFASLAEKYLTEDTTLHQTPHLAHDLHKRLPDDEPIWSDIPNAPLAILTAEAAILAPIRGPNPSSQTLETAIQALGRFIKANPTYPSGYNNRAQALYLLYEQQFDLVTKLVLTTFFEDIQSAITEASSDYNNAGSYIIDRLTVVSPANAKVIAAAYHQYAVYLQLILTLRAEGILRMTEDVGSQVEKAIDAYTRSSWVS